MRTKGWVPGTVTGSVEVEKRTGGCLTVSVSDFFDPAADAPLCERGGLPRPRFPVVGTVSFRLLLDV